MQGRRPYQSSRRGRPTRPGSPQQQFLLLSSLLGLFGVWFLSPVSVWITDGILLMVPLEADVEMGREAWNEMRRDYRSVPDLWGVGRIGHELVRSSLAQDDAYRSLPWSFEVIHADFVNAFALPGGIVRVTDKLLNTLDLSDAELAALIGHEMGHVINRHSQGRVLQDQLVSFVIQSLIYEDNDGHKESFGEAIGELLLKSARFLGQQSFSRKDEYQADATAWDLLVESGVYSPKGMEGVLRKLWDLHGGSGETSWEATHPGTKDRISALTDIWKQLPTSEKWKLNAYPRK